MPKKTQRKKDELFQLIAVIYARYSSHAQNDASIEQQVEKCMEYARKRGIKVVATYSDRAMTGKSDRRPDFQRMMKDAGKGMFNCVIAWKSNRLGRNMLEAMLNDARLTENGVRCMYVEEDFGDTAAGRFALRNMMNVNQFYSENMAEDIRRGLADNAAKCKVNGSLPYGYKSGKDHRYEIDEVYAPVVREVFQRYAKGESAPVIASSLIIRKIKPLSSKEWCKNSIYRILKNERYCGIYEYGDVRIEGGIPRIIDQELFDAVQRRIRMKNTCKGRHRNDMDYLLTGKLFCGHCGSQMTGMSGTSKMGAVYYYYVCQGKKQHACKKKNVRKDVIESAVAEAIIKYLLTPENIDWMTDIVMEYNAKLQKESQLAHYQDELVDVKRSISNIMKAIEAGIFTASTKERLQELEDEKVDLQQRIETEKRVVPQLTRDMVHYYFEHFAQGNVHDPEFQRDLIDQFITAIYLYDDKVKITFDYSDDAPNIEVPLTLDDMDADTEYVEKCSFSAHVGVPICAKTNTLRFIRGVFVFTFYFDNSDD